MSEGQSGYIVTSGLPPRALGPVVDSGSTFVSVKREGFVLPPQRALSCGLWILSLLLTLLLIGKGGQYMDLHQVFCVLATRLA